MKKLISIVFTALLLSTPAVIGQGFTINGTIDGASDGKVIVQKRGGEKFATGVTKGQFTLKGKIIEPGLYTMTLEGIRGSVSLFLQNTEFNVKAAVTKNSNYDILESKEVKGGEAQEVWNKFMDLNIKINEVFREETAGYMEAYRAKDEAKTKELQPVYDAASEKRKKAIFGFIKENSDCLVAAHLLNSQSGQIDDPAILEEMINGLSPKMASTSYVKDLNATLETKKKTAVGAIAPDFTQNDQNGKPVSLSDFRGKYVLIDFWASWCGPCRQENPNVVAAYNKFKSKNFTVLGVSLDRDNGYDAWLKAIEDDKLTWTHVSDLKFWDNEVARDYGVRSIPANLLIDKNGKILAKNLKGDDLHTELKKLVK